MDKRYVIYNTKYVSTICKSIVLACNSLILVATVEYII